MEQLFTKSWLRVYSALFINFAYGYFAIGFITPKFLNLSVPNSIVSLTWNLFLGILFLLAAARAQEILDNYE